MERDKRLHRVALLCCHFIRNCAYYKAGWNGNTSLARNDFWITVQNNFIDIAVLEWMKLFGDYNDKHHWQQIAQDKDLFKINMLNYCQLDRRDLSDCHQTIKKYRDKFVAHLDSEDVMKIPSLDNALKLAQYYYKYVFEELKPNDQTFPANIKTYYERCFEESKKWF